jgi:hypothetical protein
MMKVELNQSTGSLNSVGSKIINLKYYYTIQAQWQHGASHALVRIHFNFKDETEYVAWLEIPINNDNKEITLDPKVIDNIPNGSWIYDDEGNKKTPLGVWIPISYTASFRKAGDLNADNYQGRTYKEAYGQVSTLDKEKAWRDDSSVTCNDGAPYWWQH